MGGKYTLENKPNDKFKTNQEVEVNARVLLYHSPRGASPKIPTSESLTSPPLKQKEEPILKIPVFGL